MRAVAPQVALQSTEKMRLFKDSLFELAAKFISSPPPNLGREIERGLRFIGEFWGFDWVILTEVLRNNQELKTIYNYTAPGVPKYSISPIVGEFRERLLRGETISFSRLPDELPENDPGREFCAKVGIRASLIVPLKFGESIQGTVGVVSRTPGWSWPEEFIKEFRLVAEVLANALERKKIITLFDEQLRFEHLLSRISATYINLATHEIETEIKKDLGRLAELLGVDRCMLYSLAKDNRSFRFNTPYVWSREEDVDFLKVTDRLGQDDLAFFEELRYMFQEWLKGKHVKWTRMSELPEEAHTLKASFAGLGVKSHLSIPIFVAGSVVGAIAFSTTHSHRTWQDDLVPKLRLFGEVFFNALIRQQSQDKLQKAFSEIKVLKDRVEADYLYLKEEVNFDHGFGEIVGRSSAFNKILAQVKQVAHTDVTVLLLGETGTGKGLIARAIHNASRHKDRPLMQVNCATLSPNLVESELFGYEKGAFTGAQGRRIGRFEAANGTTLFLDEIGELPLELQAKLLRVLQDGEFERVGGTTTVKTEVRIIAATNRDLKKEMEEGRFRQDLWYRLSVFPIVIPPLRGRLDDIPLFVRWFADQAGKRIGKKFDSVSQETIKHLQGYSWPGNIRELQNLVERAAITSPAGDLRIEIPEYSGSLVTGAGNLEEVMELVERESILRALNDADWVIDGPQGAAKRLGLAPSTLRYRMRTLCIERQRNSEPSNVERHEGTVDPIAIKGPSRDAHDESFFSPGLLADSDGGGTTLDQFEANHIFMALEKTGWIIEGEQGAARRLGIKPSTLRSRMQRLNIQRSKPPTAHGRFHNLPQEERDKTQLKTQ